MASRPVRIAAAAAAVVTPLVALTAPAASAHSARQVVYTLSNQVSGNAVLSYARTGTGAFTPIAATYTGGTGTGAGLGSQGALTLAGNRLVAVNPGSNSITVFGTRPDGTLRWLDTIASGGVRPISITVHDDLAYVLNGVDNTVSGFRFVNDDLEAIPGSTRTLGGAAPAQVSFTPAGDQLVVTEKGTNTIEVLPVAADGKAGPGVVNASVGTTPFGFAFADGHLVVSNAFGGAAGSSSISTYDVNADGTLTVIAGDVKTGQSAACWIAVTPNGRFAYATNAGSANLTGIKLTSTGSFSVLTNGVSGAAGTTPIDADVDARSLFALNAGSHEVTVSSINSDGSLTSQTSITGLPVGAVGLAVR